MEIILPLIIWPIVILIITIFFLVSFRQEIRYFIKDIRVLKTKWFETKRVRKQLFAKVEEVEKIAAQIQKDSKDIEDLKLDIKEFIRSYIEIYAFDLSTRDISPMPKGVRKKAEKELNRMLDKIFPEEKEKAKFLLKLEKKFHNYKQIK